MSRTKLHILWLLQMRIKSSGNSWVFYSLDKAVWTDLNKLHAFIADYFDVLHFDLIRVSDDEGRVWVASFPESDVEFRIIEVPV